MRLLLSALHVLSLAACTSYHYITMDSTDIPLDRRKAFMWETDTVSVAYQFSGEGGLMSVFIFNKSSQPLYINWKKSAVITGGMTVPLFNRNVIANGVMSTDSYLVGDNQTAGYSQFSASFDLPEGIEFLPPQSGLSRTVITLQEISVNSTALPAVVEQEKMRAADGMVSKIRRVYYTDEKSPLRFRTYLTLAMGKNAENEFSVQHSFYAKEVMQSTTPPELFSMYRANGSQFYILQDVQ